MNSVPWDRVLVDTYEKDLVYMTSFNSTLHNDNHMPSIKAHQRLINCV